MESTGQNVSGHTPPEGSEKKTNEELTQQLTENQDPFSLNAIVNDAIVQHWSNRLWFCESDDEVLKILRHSKVHKRHSGESKAAIAQQKIDKPLQWTSISAFLIQRRNLPMTFLISQYTYG
jgi:hypothetical protein